MSNVKNILKATGLAFWAVACVCPLRLFAADNPNPATTYQFQSNTVWGKLSVFVQTSQGRFHMECQSDTSVSHWFLKDEKDRKIASGSGGSSNGFKADVPLPFQASYKLTVLVKGDQGDVPVVLNLSPEGEAISSTPTPPPYDPYVEDPQRPYDKIVRNLYDQAGQAFVEGDPKKALEYLDKARELDPSQPQVLGLIGKIETETEGSASKVIVQKAAKDWKSGDPEQALNELGDFLGQYPNDGPALRLQQQIMKSQAAAPSSPSKKHRTKSASVKPKPSPQPVLGEKDTQAKADEAYNLGLESYRKEDFASAKKFWEETLRLEPNHPQARRNLDRLKEEHPELK